jgi:hypothetical protein
MVEREKKDAHPSESALPLELYSKGVHRTGFVLEFGVGEVLRRQGWVIIGNRYYLDDVQAAVREIDIVAYKVDKVRDFLLYTTLMISCKRSADRIWALLSKDINTRDPNRDWHPLHTWTNCAECDEMLSGDAARRSYVDAVQRSDASACMRVPDSHLFAFQEMQADTGKPENDSAIFGSVTSLLKALAYEKSMLPGRAADRRLYQFNLLSVVDAPGLVRLHFQHDDVLPRTTSDEIYLADYIVNRERFSARVHFVAAGSLEPTLRAYAALHETNRQYFGAQYDEFYETVLTTTARRQAVLPLFRTLLSRRIIAWLPDGEEEQFSAESLDAFWDGSEKLVKITCNLPPNVLPSLNSDDFIMRGAKAVLERAFHYTGPFTFAEEEEVPF